MPILRFQPLDRVAEGRLGDAELRRCTREALLLGHSHKPQEVVEVVSGHALIPLTQQDLWL